MAIPAFTAAAVTRPPAQFGLFSVALMRPDSGRWRLGVQFEQEVCGPASVVPAEVCDDGEFTGYEPVDMGDETPRTFKPFTVYSLPKCSFVGTSQEQLQDRSERHVQSTEEAAVERYFWETYLLPEVAGVELFVDLHRAVGALEGQAYEYGGVGVIHASRDMATWLLSAGLAEVRGNRLQTKLGTPIVAGVGYPNDSNELVYTAVPAVYRGDLFTPFFSYDLFDRGNNDLYGFTARDYLVGFEECGYMAVTVERE